MHSRKRPPVFKIGPPPPFENRWAGALKGNPKICTEFLKKQPATGEKIAGEKIAGEKIAGYRGESYQKYTCVKNVHRNPKKVFLTPIRLLRYSGTVKYKSQKQYETRQRDRGLVQTKVWVPRSLVPLLKRYAERLRKEDKDR